MRLFMGVLVVLGSLFLMSWAHAAVSNFNSVIGEASHAEKSSHKDVLKNIQNTEVAQAYNQSWNKTAQQEAHSKPEMTVRLVIAAQ